MKIRVSLIIFLLLFYSSSVFPQDNNNEWYPFYIPENLDLNSPANIGKLVLDAPAGKHGFVKAKGDHFEFEDGTPIKFWGINLCFNACFPDKKYAEILADRIAFFGFNAVRLHHMDYYFEPRGIFKDIAPAYKNPQLKKTSILSPEQLDKLDYFIFQLKRRGIYLDMNLLVARHFTEADGVKDASELGKAAKPVSMFDPKLIELQKQYAKDILNHLNPYTKLKYSEDPAIALIEITNENSLNRSWKKGNLGNLTKNNLISPGIPKYYSDELYTMWNKWIETNNPTLNKQFNLLTINNISKLNLAKDEFISNLEYEYFENMLKFLKNDCSIKVPITGIGGSLQPEDKVSERNCDFFDVHFYWDHPKFPTKKWDKNNFKIHNRSLLRSKKLGIISDIANFQIEDKPYTITEWNHCYPNEYAYETPSLIATKATQNGWDGLFQFAFSHGWKTEPSFNDIQSYFDAIANAQKLITSSIGSYIYIGNENKNTAVKNGIFTINSAKIIGLVGFIKDKFNSFDNITIKSNDDGAIFIYSTDNKPLAESKNMILIALSDIKNTGSSWKDGKFNWGSAPTLLKKVNADIGIKTDKAFKVYELASTGKRGKELSVKAKSFSINNSNTPWFEIAFE